MNACELTTYITAIANTLSCKLSIDELEILSAVLLQLGETLDTIATHKKYVITLPLLEVLRSGFLFPCKNSYKIVNVISYTECN